MDGAIDGRTVYVGVGSMDMTDVGAGAVLTSNEGPMGIAVVGLVVDDEGERVEPWGGELGVGPVVVVGTGAGSVFCTVPVGDSVADASEGANAGVRVEASCIEGVALWTGVGGAMDGSIVYVDVGSMGVTDVGAGAVLASNEGPSVIPVVGLVVDDEGETVEVWGGKLCVSPVMVVGNAVGSALGTVPVGDRVTGPRVGSAAGVSVETSSFDGVDVETGVGGANEGLIVYVGVGSIGVTGGGAGAVLTPNEGARVVSVVGLVVDDGGEVVESWGCSLGVGRVVIGNTGVGSAFTAVPVGDSVTDS